MPIWIRYSSSNSITFDGWSSQNGNPYLGITIRTLIDYEFKDYFLNLVELSLEDAANISTKVFFSLMEYGLDLQKITSCTTDNCATMQAAVKDLNIGHIPCVCHILNLIFKEFIDNCLLFWNLFQNILYG